MKNAMVLFMILALTTAVLSQKSVLFLVGAGQEATGPEVSDDIVLDVLESCEWDVDVYYLDDASKMTDSLGLDKDLVVISSTINSSHVGEFYYDKPVPIFTWESGMYGKLGIATGGSNITLAETFLIITEDGQGHPALGDYTGDVEVLLNSPMEVTLIDTSQYSENVQPLAEMIMDDGTPRTAIFAIDEGATLVDTTAAPARRMGFFFRDKTAEEASEDALAILSMCLKWTMGDVENSVDDLRSLLADYDLFNNYPNPFNPSTIIPFCLPKSDKVTVTVYNKRGQKVKTLLSATVSEGSNVVQWNGTDEMGRVVPSGIYYYELSSSQGQLRNRMILLK